MNRILYNIQKFSGKKTTKLFYDVTILIASGYLTLAKICDFSLTGWLLRNAFQQQLVNVFVFVSAVLVIAAIILKVINMVCESLLVSAKHAIVPPDKISDCLYVMNQEIHNHLHGIKLSQAEDLQEVKKQHQFETNIRLIVDALAEHIRKTIDSKVKKKDLFISLYAFDSSNRRLEYVFHFDPARDLVKSKTILLDDKKFKSYECVKCLASTDITAYKLRKDDYAKGNSKRYKSLQHYMGCKLHSNGEIFGFLNIEFHNSQVFYTEDEMQDFMEENVFPFRLLLEYQYLKQHFFAKLDKLGA